MTSVFVVCGVALLSLLVTSAVAQPIIPETIHVIDGDTVALKGSGPHIRLVGFNAPETRNAQCSEEAELGERAKDRLNQLVSDGSLDLIFVRCSCQPGTEGTRWCNYGRRCGTLTAHGQDVGRTLIAEGLAVPFVCGETSCPPTPRPWCY